LTEDTYQYWHKHIHVIYYKRSIWLVTTLTTKTRLITLSQHTNSNQNTIQN